MSFTKRALILAASFYSVTLIHANGTSLAELSYRGWAGTCPSGNPRAQSLNCDSTHNDIGKDAVAIGESEYLASLAKMRSVALGCAQTQLAQMQKSPAELDNFVARTSEKLIMLAYFHKKMDELQPAIAIDSLAKDQYKKFHLLSDALESSIPFHALPAMHQAEVYASSMPEMLQQEGPDPSFSESLQKLVRDSIPNMSSMVGTEKSKLDKGILDGGASLSDPMRESLAQDSELVEAFHQQNKEHEETYRSLACKVDAKYGRGAIYRDNAIQIAMLAFTGAGLIARTGAVGLTIASGRTAASSISLFRASGAFAGIAAMTSGVDLANTVNKCIKGDGNLGGNLRNGSCDNDVIRNLAPQDCLLRAGLDLANMLPGVPWTKLGKLLRKKPPLGAVDEANSVIEAKPSMSTPSFARIGSKLDSLNKSGIIPDDFKSKFMRNINDLSSGNDGALNLDQTDGILDRIANSSKDSPEYAKALEDLEYDNEMLRYIKSQNGTTLKEKVQAWVKHLKEDEGAIDSVEARNLESCLLDSKAVALLPKNLRVAGLCHYGQSP